MRARISRTASTRKRQRGGFAAVVVPLVLAGLVFGTGCNKVKRALGGSGSQDESVVGKPLPKTHSSGKKIRMGQECELDKTVSNPSGDTPEWVLAELLAAASSPRDDDAAFERFYKHFPESRTRKEVRSLYWGRARKYVKKYLVDAEGQPLMAAKPSKEGAATAKPAAGGPATAAAAPQPGQDVRFVECRREEKSEGRVKIYIKSFDENKSNPPITFQKDDKGVWKVVFFTP